MNEKLKQEVLKTIKAYSFKNAADTPYESISEDYYEQLAEAIIENHF